MVNVPGTFKHPNPERERLKNVRDIMQHLDRYGEELPDSVFESMTEKLARLLGDAE